MSHSVAIFVFVPCDQEWTIWQFRALRLDQGVFSWATEAISRKVRIIDVVYNASNNELVRTKTLVKGAIVTIDSTPFRQVKLTPTLSGKIFCKSLIYQILLLNINNFYDDVAYKDDEF